MLVPRTNAGMTDLPYIPRYVLIEIKLVNQVGSESRKLLRLAPLVAQVERSKVAVLNATPYDETAHSRDFKRLGPILVTNHPNDVIVLFLVMPLICNMRTILPSGVKRATFKLHFHLNQSSDKSISDGQHGRE